MRHLDQQQQSDTIYIEAQIGTRSLQVYPAIVNDTDNHTICASYQEWCDDSQTHVILRTAISLTGIIVTGIIAAGQG